MFNFTEDMFSLAIPDPDDGSNTDDDDTGGA